MTDPAAIGTRYGHRVVIGPAKPVWHAASNNRNGRQRVERVRVRCDCGYEQNILLRDLNGGKRACSTCANAMRSPPSKRSKPPVIEFRADAGKRCGYRPQCPPDGHLSCRYYLPLHDLCALTCADMGGLSSMVVGALTGVTRQAILHTEGKMLCGFAEQLQPIHDDGFEHGATANGGRMTHKRGVR